MADKRQDLIDKIIEKMEAITDFGDSIADFETNWHQDELPALSIFDTDATHTLANDEPEAFSQISLVSVSLQIYVADSPKPGTIRDLMQKVRNIIKDNRTWDDLAMWTKPIRSQINIGKTNPDAASFDIIGASIEIEVAVMSDSFDF